MGRPPTARSGSPMAVAGRRVVAGVGSHERQLSPRATAVDLWASIEALTLYDAGVARLAGLHGTSLDTRAKKRLAAFVRQARAYYGATRSSDPSAKPLLGYYFALNLVKAYLTVVDPPTTLGKLGHGVSDSTKPGSRYRFTQEYLKIQGGGVAGMFASRTGMGHYWPKGELIQVSRLLPYLVEAVDLFADATGKKPKLLPVHRTYVKSTSKRGGGNAWLVVDVRRSSLDEHAMSANEVLRSAAIFGALFDVVHDSQDPGTVTYEARLTHTYARRQQVLRDLRLDFDGAMILRDRTRGLGQDHVVLSRRPGLMSSEAVTLILLLHLSNIVRYRPQYVEALRASPYAWLVSSWVDRASENLLLSLASRISLEEHVIA